MNASALDTDPSLAAAATRVLGTGLTPQAAKELAERLTAREFHALAREWVRANFADAESACLTVDFGPERTAAVLPVRL